MLITNCAACAAPLAHDAPRCVRCKTRYCNSTCQHDHWRRGHKQICKRIHRGGNAEQYHAEKKYKEAVAEAIEKCADDTKGQTCYICTEPVHWKTNEGLVRGCACRGTAGFAHVSCLAEQAKILVAEAEENNLGAKALNGRWLRWSTCGLCEQDYHGVVFCALGWACWKTYLGRPETHWARQFAMNMLGLGLYDAHRYEDALSVREVELSMLQRNGASEEELLPTESNLAISYQSLGWVEEALEMRQKCYAGYLKYFGEQDPKTIVETNTYAGALQDLNRLKEAKTLLRKAVPVARRVLGESNDLVIIMRNNYAKMLYADDRATLDDLHEAVKLLEDLKPFLHEAVKLLEDLKPFARRVLGGAHPLVANTEHDLKWAREALSARQAPHRQAPLRQSTRSN